MSRSGPDPVEGPAGARSVIWPQVYAVSVQERKGAHGGAGPTEVVLEELWEGLSCDWGSSLGERRLEPGGVEAKGAPNEARKRSSNILQRGAPGRREEVPGASWDPQNTPQGNPADTWARLGFLTGSKTVEERELHHFASPEVGRRWRSHASAGGPQSERWGGLWCLTVEEGRNGHGTPQKRLVSQGNSGQYYEGQPIGRYSHYDPEGRRRRR
ncbi:hypothetical protein NDU88_005463 [Pleurodeles waltl]|uniref:Uncharacterized protein n=1 Tax=Pleurodeles waltl TaxID=8319 RepID=A0AAV7TCC5_PLEWA|nr:hypothetical protein NDU88_005463 [Pleurodeles waltl]